jgi:hypothetical protein
VSILVILGEWIVTTLSPFSSFFFFFLKKRKKKKEKKGKIVIIPKNLKIFSLLLSLSIIIIPKF